MFGKKRERLRQWSLLGFLLRGARLLEALDYMGVAFGTAAVEWFEIREQAALGGSLLEIARDAALDTPSDVLQALERGEQDGRLPERLADLIPRKDTGTAGSAVDEGAVVIVNQTLREAVEQGASGLLLVKSANGDGELKFLLGDFWTPRSRHPAEEFADMVRRIWILAGQPYWAPKVGVFRTRLPEGFVELRVSPDRKGGLGIEVLSTSAS
jgi:hypothetical protein